MGRERGRTGAKKKILCKWTLLPPSWVVLLTILSVLAEKQKWKIDYNFQFSIFLSHATDCNMVRKAKLLLSFIFLLIVESIKVKICYVSILYQKEKKVKNFWLCTLTFWHQFSIFDFRQKLNEQMTHGPQNLLDLCRVNLSAIFLYNTILHCAKSSLTKKIMVKAIDCNWNQGFIAVYSWLLYGVTPFKPVASLVRKLLVVVARVCQTVRTH